MQNRRPTGKHFTQPIRAVRPAPDPIVSQQTLIGLPPRRERRPYRPTSAEKRAVLSRPPQPTAAPRPVQTRAGQIPVPPPAATRVQRQPVRRVEPRPPVRRVNKWWLIAPLAGLIVMAVSVCAVVTLSVGLMYAGGVLPRVSAGGLPLGGLSEAEAAARLRDQWDSITLRDAEMNREWSYDPAQLGISIDAEATARKAFAQGRSEGNALQAMLGGLDVAPAVNIDLVTAAVAFDQLAPQINLPPVNAGVALVDGRVQATPPQEGRALDVAGLVSRLEHEGGAALADGVLDMPMLRVQPTVIDASPVVARAAALLANSLQIHAYDPITDESKYWTINPEQWGDWLTATPDPASDIGLALTLDPGALTTYFNAQVSSLGGGRYVDINEAVRAVQRAVENNQTAATVRIYHEDTQHVVQSGETLMTIAWDYGVPYPWIEQANPGLGDNLSVGQSITIPSPDNFMEHPIVPNKRIEISIPEQRVRVYENGQIKWDWIASTGINSSPTWPGVYQVILHDENAYASNWNLYMPWFVGVYRPVPGAGFINGFHGFPTRGGSQLLWTNSLGTRVTYGCILLDSTNAKLLYDWAEEGVVVEIQG